MIHIIMNRASEKTGEANEGVKGGQKKKSGGKKGSMERCRDRREPSGLLRETGPFIMGEDDRRPVQGLSSLCKPRKKGVAKDASERQRNPQVTGGLENEVNVLEAQVHGESGLVVALFGHDASVVPVKGRMKQGVVDDF
jgi:hypothetical protein